MKLSPQTQKVYERMKNGEWLSQEQCFAEKITFRLSNKIRSLEAAGFVIDRERVAPGRMDMKYKIVKKEEKGNTPIIIGGITFEPFPDLSIRKNVENKNTLF